VRRINLRAVGLAAAALGLVVAAGCQANTNEDGGGEQADYCGKKIGFFGALTGENAAIVIPSRDGAKLAFKEYNEANPDCQLEMVEFDTQGDPDQAATFAQQVVSDQDFLGVIGGAFSGETHGTIPVYQGGGVPMISPSATRVDLSGRPGITVFHRVVGHDGTQSAAIAKFLQDEGATKVFLVDDGSAYGAGLTAELAKRLDEGDPQIPYVTDKIQEEQTIFDATVAKIQAEQPDYIFYGGYPREAAPLFRQIRSAGITAQLLGADGLYDPQLASITEGAAEGAIITCPCLPAEEAAGTFAEDFEAEYGTAPGSYGAEGYDAAKVFIDVISAGASTREEVLAGIKAYDKQGASKHIKFDAGGDVDPSVVVVWSYEVTSDGLEPLKPLGVQ
jgi:branched-chain amino acid transport system substrate-binding protein